MLYSKVNILNSFFLFGVVTTIFFSSCSNTKNLADNQSLLVKNKILCDSKTIAPDELQALLKQRENQKSFFFFRFYTTVYNSFSKGKGSSFKKWVITHIGSEPVLFDELMADKTQNQLTQYMYNKGFFLAEVSKKVITKQKKTKVLYDIKSNKPYVLQNIRFLCDDTVLLKQVTLRNKNSLLVKGENFDVQKFENERERIAKILHQNGYYFFEKDFVVYEVDSALQNNSLNVDVKINMPFKNDSALQTLRHKKYKIDKTYVIIDYDYKEVLKNKTAFFESLDTLKIQDNVFMLYKGKPYVKPQVIQNCNYIKNGEMYNLSDVEKTRLYLSQNSIFRQISIEFAETEHTPSDTLGHMDCFIQISPSVKQGYSVNLEGTNTGGDWGAQIKATYENKNAFKGAEIFASRIHFSYEQNSWLKTDVNNDFNSRDYGLDMSVISPKFIFPFGVKGFTKRYGLRTFIKGGYNFQKIPSYERPLRYFSYGYISRNNRFLTQYFTPLEINGVQYINKTNEFITYIKKHNISKNFEDYYISSTNYSLNWQNKPIEKIRDYSVCKYSIDFAGNILYMYSTLTNRPKTQEGSYKFFNTTFAQYIKQDIEIKHYFVQDIENATVLRLFTGLAIPYGNNNVVPNIKQYFAGGSNSMRAWHSLGPGSYRDTNASNLIYSISDVKLEANIEQRFAIFRFLNGAVFADIGNIWSIHEIDGQKGTVFSKNFYKDIAIATGVGLRPNFSFFILRLDFAVKLRDPSYDETKRWLWIDRSYSKSKDNPDYNLTIGIGYPF